VTAITTVLNVVQAIIVVRILDPAEYGLVGIVLGVGAIVGVAQHLGVQAGATKETAIVDGPDQVFVVFSASILFRLMIAVPLAVAMFFGAKFVAIGIYDAPEILGALRVFAASVVLQGVSGVLNATLNGLRRFDQIFQISVIRAVLRLTVYPFMTWLYRIEGYFVAIVIVNGIVLLWQAWMLRGVFQGGARLLEVDELKTAFRKIFRVGWPLYVVKILRTLWQRAGTLLLGIYVAPVEVGYFNFATDFGTRTALISNAFNVVNLSHFSRLYHQNRAEFVRVCRRNFLRGFTFIWFVTVSYALFSRPLFLILVGPAYEPAFNLLVVVIIASFSSPLAQIVGSSILVPSRNQNQGMYAALLNRVVGITIMFVLVYLGYGAAGAVAGMFLGDILSNVWVVRFLYKRAQVPLLDKRMLYVLVMLLPSLLGLFLQTFWLRTVLYLVNACLFLCVIHVLKIIDVRRLFSQVLMWVVSLRAEVG